MKFPICAFFLMALTFTAAAQTSVAPPPRPGQSAAPAPVVQQSPAVPDSLPPVEGTPVKNGDVAYMDILPGTGEPVKPDQYLVIRNTVYLATTRKHVSFPVNPGDIIYNTQINRMFKGMQLGLDGIRPGGKRRLFIPAAVAWGANGYKNNNDFLIPPNTDLIADVEIIAASDFPTGPPVKQVAGVPGPPLDETLKFIADRLASDATTNFIAFGTNTNDNSNYSVSISYIESPFHIDTGACLISNHEKHISNGATISDTPSLYTFSQYEEVIVKPAEQYLTEMNAKGGSPNSIINSTNPPTVALLMRHSNTSLFDFFFLTDASIADRVAKAMTHAIELCGGGKKEPF